MRLGQRNFSRTSLAIFILGSVFALAALWQPLQASHPRLADRLLELGLVGMVLGFNFDFVVRRRH